jgi:hypothetical protein
MTTPPINSDYLRLIFLQIERANSSKPEELYGATLKLRLLCEMIADEQYITEVGMIEDSLLAETEYEELAPDENEYHKAGIKVLSACLSLLKRKGLIEG